MYATFTDALMQSKRASQLRGVPFSTADTRNLQAGYMADATERANAERSSKLAEDTLTSNNANFAAQLAQEKLNTEAQIDAANKASTKQMISSGIGTAASLAGAKLIAGGGTAAGAGAGLSTQVGGPGVYGLAPAGGAAAGSGSTIAGMTPAYGAGAVAALVAGGLLTKKAAEPYTDRGGVTGYAARSAQHPVAAVLDPNTAIVDAFGIDRDTALGQMANAAIWPEEKVTGWIADAAGTVICTELNRQGLLSDAIYRADAEYRAKSITDAEYAGYLFLAGPVVKLMQKSPRFTRLFAPLAVATATEMASRADTSVKGTPTGRAVLAVMVPICGLVGEIIALKVGKGAGVPATL